MNAQLRVSLPYRFASPAAALVPIRSTPLHRLRRQRLEPAQAVDLARAGLVLGVAGDATVLAHDWSLALEGGSVLVADGRERLQLRAGAGGATLLCGWPDPLALAPPAQPGRGQPARGLLLPLLHPPGSRLARLMQDLAAGLDADAADLQGHRGQAWLDAVLAAQHEHAAAIDRCHGRTEARRRDLYVRLARTRALLSAPGSGGLEVAALARIARLSTSHYVRLFHQVFGEPPHRLRSRLRMERARALLLEGTQPIAAILSQAGYTSHSCFARAFRQHFGCSATELRSGNGEWGMGNGRTEDP